MALSFMYDLKARIRTRFQLSTDSFAPYRDAVDSVFGEDIDYAQIHKITHRILARASLVIRLPVLSR